MIIIIVNNLFTSRIIVIMRKSAKQANLIGGRITEMPDNEIVRAARGFLTQTAFATALQTRQSLISKYESGKNAPPTNILKKCIAIIQGENIDDDVSLGELEARMRKILKGPAQAQARRAFAVILDSIA